MKILYSVSNFRFLTGAELYVYELAREMVKDGHEVGILAQIKLEDGIKNELQERAEKLGIKVFDFQGFEASMFPNPSVLHVQQKQASQFALQQYPDVPCVATVHSEFPVEDPLVDPRIKHYICIRPTIQEKITTQDKIDPTITSVVYNPIDASRFHEVKDLNIPRDHKKQVLFVGTIDYLRRFAIFDLIHRAIKEDFELTIVGKKFQDYLNFDLPPNVAWHDQVWDIENLTKYCDETAGIVLGRTTIEGWFCGKPGWIYDVGHSGEIISRELFQVPDDIEKYDSKNVSNQIKEIYNDVIR
jgi:glycosyltransferase involved in cell wall biosynthesis